LDLNFPSIGNTKAISKIFWQPGICMIYNSDDEHQDGCGCGRE